MQGRSAASRQHASNRGGGELVRMCEVDCRRGRHHGWRGSARYDMNFAGATEHKKFGLPGLIIRAVRGN